jgi:hypothetical protein
MKKCIICGNEKSESLFYAKHSKCKECYCAVVRKYRKDNIEKVLDYDRLRANLPHRVEARLNYSKTTEGKKAGNKAKVRWAESNLVKRAASTIVGNAVRYGKLIKPVNCSTCNKEARLHGHHDDYAYPMVVRWLCSECHFDWHKLNGSGLNG